MMGTLRSETDHTGLMVNGVALGQPARDVDDNEQPIGEYRWDDSRFPDGLLDAEGVLTPDEVDDGEELGSAE
jgi:hypothetical protein